MRWFVGVLLFLTFTVSAHADFGGGGELAKRIALERWPVHCSPWSIVYRDLPDSLGYVANGTCVIQLDRTFHEYTWLQRCTLLSHEMGHLAGFPDQKWPPILRRRPPVFKPCIK